KAVECRSTWLRVSRRHPRWYRPWSVRLRSPISLRVARRAWAFDFDMPRAAASSVTPHSGRSTVNWSRTLPALTSVLNMALRAAPLPDEMGSLCTRRFVYSEHAFGITEHDPC